MPSVENLLGLTLQKCSNPVRIKDDRHGGYIFVPCGHCINCNENRRNTIARRLDLESQGSADTLFVTLTYDNEHVSNIMLDVTESMLVSNRVISSKNPAPQVVIPLDDSNKYELNALVPLQSKDGDSVDYTYSYVNKVDVQKFLKRLRRLISYDKENLLSSIPPENRTFRYFICSEYGPKTLRAHYHGLLFFSDVRISEAVRSHYIHKAWKLCSQKNLRVERLIGAASSYVAKYVNKSSGVPHLLRLPATRTFYLASRKPAIGVAYLNKIDIRNQVQKRSLTYNKNVKSKDGSVSIVSMPYPKRISGYYYPKCYDYVNYSRRELCTLYGSFEGPNIVNQVCRKYKIRTASDKCGNKLSRVYHLLTDEERIYGISSNRTAAKRCYLYCLKYGCSVEQYVDDLISYHAHLASESIRFFCDYLNDHHVSLKTLISAYSSAFTKLPIDVDMLVYDNSNYALESLLNDYGLTLTDLYDTKGNLLPLYAYDYINSSEFKKYSDTILQKRFEFNQKRLFTHYTNQLNCNYETF